MSHEIEQIEARLTAYIDGQLPEKDRAEIEAYLASNPTHARLITELQRQRAQVRTLPRESVPAEIMDHLQAHLERHSLLSDGEMSSAMKINRWPQFGAVAAVLLLAVGLGVLVYQVLPNSTVKPEQMVMAPPTVQQLPQVPPLLNDAEMSAKDSEKTVAGAAATLPADMLDASAPMATRGLAAQPGDAVDHLDDSAAMLKSTMPARLPDGPLTDASAIIIASDDPVMTRSLLASYLIENGLTFGTAKPPLIVDGTPAPTTEPGGAMSVAEVVQKLQVRHELPTTLPSATQAHQPSDLFVVRDVQPQQLLQLRQEIDRQRVGRQHAELIDTQDLRSSSMPQSSAEALPTVEPAQFAAAEALRDRSASTQPVGFAAAHLSETDAPATQPLTADVIGNAGDVLVVVVAKASTGDRPLASSMPSSMPAPLPEPPQKPIPMMPTPVANNLPATRPTTMP